MLSSFNHGNFTIELSLSPPPSPSHTPIHTHRAASKGHLHVVEFLLEQGAHAVVSPTTNLTALHYACLGGHTDVVNALLNKLPALLAIDDSPQETSLHMAAREGHVEIVRNLLAVAARAEQLKTPEHSYEEEPYLYGHDNEKVRMNESLPEMVIDVMAPTVNGKRTPLHEAATHGHVEVVKLLVDFLREYRSHSSSAHCTPLKKSDLETVNSLNFLKESPRNSQPQGSRKANAVPGIDTMTLRGRTAFHEAARLGHLEVMEVLLQAGADINAFMRPALDVTINTDLTALVQACLMSRIDIVRFLLQHGATDARLKALSRTLRIPHDDVAGLLLCYNGGVQVVSTNEGSRSGKKKTPEKENPIVMLDLSWNSKNLSYVRKEWLQLATTEITRPSNSQLCAISQLDISSNNLKEVPIGIFQLPHLTELDMSRNRISFLPVLPNERNGGWTCHKLNHFEINVNQLTSLPPCLFSLRELKEFYANSNKIKEVPIAVWTAPCLRKLYLNRNELEVVHTSYPSCGSPSTSGSPIAGSVNMVGSFADNASSLPDSGYAGSQPSFANVFRPDFRQDTGGLEYSGRRKTLSSFPFASTKTSVTQRRGTTIIPRTKLHTQAFVSRRFESFNDKALEEEDYSELETSESVDEESGFVPLEVLDFSHNKLTSVPAGLSCLAPKLTKLLISHNYIRSLGQISDYPPEIEQLDASSNELHTAIAPAATHGDTRYLQPCARKQLMVSAVEPSSPFSYKPCGHRAHRNLRKLTTLRLNNNQLVDVQLFRLVNKQKTADLTASFEESTFAVKQRANTASDPFALMVSPTNRPSPKEDLTKSISAKRSSMKKHQVYVIESPAPHDHSGSSNSSHSGGSSHEELSSPQPSPSFIISPLFPQLSTLEVTRNHLRMVPAHIHLMSNLSCLVLSHNPDIDTLPLELSNLEHLWNLEYEGCPLTNPPIEDLDKFRLAADKLLYMRSLLHE